MSTRVVCVAVLAAWAFGVPAAVFGAAWFLSRRDDKRRRAAVPAPEPFAPDTEAAFADALRVAALEAVDFHLWTIEAGWADADGAS